MKPLKINSWNLGGASCSDSHGEPTTTATRTGQVQRDRGEVQQVKGYSFSSWIKVEFTESCFICLNNMTM